MKQVLIFLFVLISVHAKADHWTRKADFPAGGRARAYGFSVGNKAYVGGGWDSLDNVTNDLWEYDPATNTWTQKTNFPLSAGRAGAASFSIGAYGYLCTGIDSATAKKDLWEYDPATNSWTQKANFPGTARSLTCAFVIGTKGYVGTGSDTIGATNDFYVYDQPSNSWSAIAPLPFIISSATGFSINNKGYLTGIFDTTAANPQVLQYTPSTNTWTSKTDFPDTARSDASTFTFGNVVYLGLGDTGGGGQFRDWWQYDTTNDTWIQKASIPCADPKDENVAFAIGNKGYIVFGSDIAPDAELWEYALDSATGIQELTNEALSAVFYPNPFSVSATFTFGKAVQNAELIIIDLCGKEVASYKNMNGTEFILNAGTLAAGAYFYVLRQNGLAPFKGKMIVR